MNTPEWRGIDDIEQFAPDTDMPLDPGIREWVLILRSRGIETFESCQGGEGHSSPESFIRFHGNAYEGFRAYTEAMNHGIPVFELRQVYVVSDGRLEGPIWEFGFLARDIQRVLDKALREAKE